MRFENLEFVAEVLADAADAHDNAGEEDAADEAEESATEINDSLQTLRAGLERAERALSDSLDFYDRIGDEKAAERVERALEILKVGAS
jgi:hypothetical protein